MSKLLTTPDDPSRAVGEVLREALQRTTIVASQIQHVVHGTTLVTNAIIERQGGRTALLTTRGFRECRWVGRQGARP